MATRFYFNVTKAADLALSRPLNGFWEVNASVLQTTRRLTTTRYGGAVIGPTVTVGNGTNPNDQLWFQGISDPLAAQTISGTLTGVMVVRESNTSANLTTKVRIYVVNKSGTVVATLYDGSGQSTEWNSPSANTRDFWDFGSASISSYTCSGGDRIVVEIGCRVASTRTADTAYMYLGDQSTTSDLPTGDASSNNQTLSPWIQFSGNLTFGYTETKTFTADSVIKGTQTGSFTLDAQIVTGGSEFTSSFGADAVIQKLGIAGSFTADAVKKVLGQPGSFTIDSWKSSLVTGSFTIDAIVQNTPAEIIDDPFDEPGTVSGEWNSKWHLITGIEGSTAEHGRSPTKGAFIYDNSNTVLDSERGGYLHRRTFLKKQMTVRAKIAQADDPAVFDIYYGVYLRHSGETGGMGYYNATYIAIDMVLNPASGYGIGMRIRSNYNTVLATVDLTSELGSWAVGDEFYIKGWVKGSRVKGKIWRVGDPEPRWQFNQSGLSIPSGAGYIGMAANTDTSWKPVEWNVRRAWAYNLDFSIDVDAVIKGTPTGSFTANSVVKSTPTGSFSMDAVLAAVLTPGSGSFTADAIVHKEASGSFSADAVAQKTASGSFSADAVKKASASGSFALDALLSTTASGSFTVDAIRRLVASQTFTLDADLKGTPTGSFSIDAVLKATSSTSFTLDAQLRVTALVSFTADAILQREQQSSATVDAIVRKGATGSFSAGALLLSPRTGSFSLDSLLVAVRAGSFTANAVLANTISGSFSMDAVLGLAVLPDIDSTVVIRMIEAQTAIHQIDFQSTLRMIEAETSFTGG